MRDFSPQLPSHYCSLLYQNKQFLIKDLKLILPFFHPLSASCFCDARMGGCQTRGQTYGLLIPRSPSTHQETLFAPRVNPSRCCISPRISKFFMLLLPYSVLNVFKTIIGCRRLTMALRGLSILEKGEHNTMPF